LHAQGEQLLNVEIFKIKAVELCPLLPKGVKRSLATEDFLGGADQKNIRTFGACTSVKCDAAFSYLDSL
jgi:hypothetical protein